MCYIYIYIGILLLALLFYCSARTNYDGSNILIMPFSTHLEDLLC